LISPLCAGYTPGLSSQERAESLANMDRLIRKGKRLREARKKLLRKGKNNKPNVIVIKEGKVNYLKELKKRNVNR
jgi:hypothetical protein